MVVVACFFIFLGLPYPGLVYGWGRCNLFRFGFVVCLHSYRQERAIKVII